MKQGAAKWPGSIYMRMMGFLLAVGVLIPVLFTAFQMGAFAREPVLETEIRTTDPDAPVLRVAADYDFCPNSYINSNGDLSGLYIESIIEVANRLGVRLEFKTGEWLECRAMLEQGEADVLLGLEIFSNMQGTLRTIPICSDDLCVYGRESLDSAAGLAGKRVALMVRSVIKTTYDLQCEYVEYYTNTEILQAEGPAGDAYRKRKLLEHYLEPVALKGDLKVADVRLLLCLCEKHEWDSRRELADFAGISRTNLTSGLQRLTMKGFLKIEEVKEPKPSRKSKAAGEVQGKAEKPETRRKDRKTKITVTILPTAEAVMKELALAQRDYDEARFVGFTEEELIKYADLSEKIKENTKRILG